VIDVRVGQPDPGNRPAPPGRLRQESLGFFPGIDQNRLGVVGIVDEVAVLGE